MILFNKNIIISSIITAIINVPIVKYVSELYLHNYLGISVISVIADFLTFNSIFFVLFFIDNRKRFFDSNDIENKQKIKKDAIKLITSLGVAEIGYITTKFLSTYVIFASINPDGSQVSITSTILAWIVYIICVNLMVKKYHLF